MRKEKLDYSYMAYLVVRAQSGDDDAFSQLYDMTNKAQYAYAYKYLQDEYLAQDALQETYAQALKHLDSIKNPELFMAWLNRINFNICFDMKKKQSQINVNALFERQEFVEEFAAPYNMEQQLIDVDSKQYILRQIMTLPLLESQVILKHYYYQMTLEEVAKSLDISRSTVKRYLNSGRDHLKELLNDVK